MRTRIKICGLTRAEDVALAARLGADAVGFVFAGGPRSLTVDQARALTAAVPAWVAKVAVLGPDQRADAAAIAEACRLDTLQLHGPADPDFCRAHRGRFTVVQALGVKDGLQEALDLIAPHVDAVLLDTAKAGLLGGTGQAFDWSRLATLRCPAPVIVAGGLGPDNVAALLAGYRPWGVDVSSGVEAAPGRKDPARLAAFFAAVAGT